MYITVTEFKAKCLNLLNEKQLQKENIIITKYGKPVAKLTSFEKSDVVAFGWMRDTCEIIGDIESVARGWDIKNISLIS